MKPLLPPPAGYLTLIDAINTIGCIRKDFLKYRIRNEVPNSAIVSYLKGKSVNPDNCFYRADYVEFLKHQIKNNFLGSHIIKIPVETVEPPTPPKKVEKKYIDYIAIPDLPPYQALVYLVNKGVDFLKALSMIVDKQRIENPMKKILFKQNLLKQVIEKGGITHE